MISMTEIGAKVLRTDRNEVEAGAGQHIYPLWDPRPAHLMYCSTLPATHFTYPYSFNKISTASSKRI